MENDVRTNKGDEKRKYFKKEKGIVENESNLGTNLISKLNKKYSQIKSTNLERL